MVTTGVPRVWAELLAVLLMGTSVSLVLSGLVRGWLHYSENGGFTSYGGEFTWYLFVDVASVGGSVVNALVVAAALGLVLVAPGPIGRLGRVVLNGVSVIGVVVAALALAGVVATAQFGPDGMSLGPSGPSDDLRSLLTRGSTILQLLPGLLVGGMVAWMAWRVLNSSSEDEGAPPDPGSRGEWVTRDS